MSNSEELRGMYLANAQAYAKKMMYERGYVVVKDWYTARPGVQHRSVRLVGEDDLHFRDTKYFCQDCERDPMAMTQFIITKDLWDTHCPDGGVICWQCFEARLGRPILLDDLEAVPLNEAFFIGARLAGSK